MKTKPQASGQINFKQSTPNWGTPKYYTAGTVAPGSILPPDRQGKRYVIGEHGELRRIKN